MTLPDIFQEALVPLKTISCLHIFILSSLEATNYAKGAEGADRQVLRISPTGETSLITLAEVCDGACGAVFSSRSSLEQPLWTPPLAAEQQRQSRQSSTSISVSTSAAHKSVWIQTGLQTGHLASPAGVPGPRIRTLRAALYVEMKQKPFNSDNQFAATHSPLRSGGTIVCPEYDLTWSIKEMQWLYIFKEKSLYLICICWTIEYACFWKEWIFVPSSWSQQCYCSAALQQGSLTHLELEQNYWPFSFMSDIIDITLLWKIRPQQLQRLLWGPLKVYSQFLSIVGLCNNIMNLKHLIEHKQEVYFVNVLKKKRSYTSSEDLFVAFIQSNSGSGSSRGSALRVKLELRTSKPGLWCFAENAEVLCSSSWCSDSASLQDSADVFLLRTVCVCSEEPAGRTERWNTSTFDLWSIRRTNTHNWIKNRDVAEV